MIKGTTKSGFDYTSTRRSIRRLRTARRIAGNRQREHKSGSRRNRKDH